MGFGFVVDDAVALAVVGGGVSDDDVTDEEVDNFEIFSISVDTVKSGKIVVEVTFSFVVFFVVACGGEEVGGSLNPFMEVLFPFMEVAFPLMKVVFPLMEVVFPFVVGEVDNVVDVSMVLLNVEFDPFTVVNKVVEGIDVFVIPEELSCEVIVISVEDFVIVVVGVAVGVVVVVVVVVVVAVGIVVVVMVVADVVVFVVGAFFGIVFFSGTSSVVLNGDFVGLTKKRMKNLWFQEIFFRIQINLICSFL